MKTKNNVQKAVLRSVAVIVSFVLVSYTVSAQEFWKKLLTNSSFNEIALAMVKTADKSDAEKSWEAEKTWDPMLKDSKEPVLEIENWMIQENHFGFFSLPAAHNEAHSMAYEERIYEELFMDTNHSEEPPLELEDWMTSAALWGN